MRIHAYLPEFPPNGDKLKGGMEKAVHGLAAGLVGNGARVTILCEGPQTSVVQSPAGYDVRCYRCTTALPTISSGLKQYIAACDDPGLFLLNGVFNRHLYPVARACTANRVPYVVAPHDPYHPSIFAKRRHLKWPYWFVRERPTLRGARAIQLLDFRHAEWLRALRVHTPVIEVVNGYAPEDVHPESALSWRLEGPPRLVYLGRIDGHNKGLDLLLEAFAQLLDQTDALLTLQGPDCGDLDAMVHRARRLGLNDRVHFRKPDFDKSAALISAEHDVFLLPSRFEGFGLSALEAMLAGRVVLVSDVAGIAPHVRESGCGIVISPNVEAIKTGLMQLLKMREKWKQMGLAGRDYALNNLRWDRIAARAIQQYRELLPVSLRESAGASEPTDTIVNLIPKLSS